MVRKSENTDELKLEVARRIKRLRTDKGWRQAELARRAALFIPDGGFGRSLISKYENAEVLPSVLNATAVARALGVEVSEVLPAADMAEPLPRDTADIKPVDTDTVHVRINQRMPAALGYKILMLIKEHEAEEKERK